jgi:hypothetical protein
MFKKIFHKLNIMHFLAMDIFELQHPFNDETVILKVDGNEKLEGSG